MMKQEDSGELKKNSKNRISLNKPEKSPSPDPDAWFEIGTLKHVIIYPIEGGAGCPQDHATSVYFSKYGLSNTLETTCDYQDRGLLLYSGKNMQAKIRLHDVLTNLNSGSLYLAIAKRLQEQPDDMETVQIKYLNENDMIEVKDLGDEVAGIVENLFGGTDIDLRLGVRSAESRFHYNFSTRNSLKPVVSNIEETDEINVYSHNFSSYTLVNTTHVRKLQSKFKKEISYKNFRPNLVVEGTPGVDYNEQDVAQIRMSDEIQEILFPIVRPLSHNTSINNNTTATPEADLEEPYSTLIKDRLITSIYPHKCRDLKQVPVFGLNMEMHYNSTEKQPLMMPGAKVFAKFLNPENPPPTEEEAAGTSDL